MATFFVYLIKSSVCLATFFFLYKWLLSKETFACFNRKVLLIGTGICLILPFIHLQITHETPVQKPFSGIEDMIVTTERNYNVLPEFPDGKILPKNISEQNANHLETTKSHQESRLSLFQIIAGLYGIGCGILFISLLVSLIRLILLLHNSRKVRYGKYTLYILKNDIPPFSIGHFVAMSEIDYCSNFDAVFAHEQIHADKRHSLDLLFAEAVILLQWFNPAAWFLKRELHHIHEYEADRGVIQSGIDATQYQLLLIKEAVGAKSYAIANGFNHCKIKNRIIMMTKQNSKQRARWKALLFVPLTAFLLFAYSQSGMGQNENRQTDVPNNSIVGTWKLVESGGKPVENYQRIKMITETQFLWTTYSPDGTALQSAGGTYTLEGNVYTELLKTTSSNMKSYLGNKGVFTIEIKDNKLYQRGLLGNNVNTNNQQFDEVWERIDDNNIIPDIKISYSLINNSNFWSVEYDKITDSKMLPLSNFITDGKWVYLDNSDAARIQPWFTTVTDKYIGIRGGGKEGFKLFNHSGKFLCSISSEGDGEDQYKNALYDDLIDDSNELVYLAPFGGNKIMVFTTSGKFVKNIIAPQQLHKPRLFLENGILTVVHMAFSGEETMVFQFDVKTGNVVKKLAPLSDLTVSNYDGELFSTRNTPMVDFQHTNKNMLLHYDDKNNEIAGIFALTKAPENAFSQYIELNKSFLTNVFGKIPVLIYTDKATKQSSFIKIVNDYSGNLEMPASVTNFRNGWYVYNLNPEQLKGQIEKRLAETDCTPKDKQILEKLLVSLKNQSNNVAFIGKLR